MIWLSSNSGIEQGSIYFDLRNVEFHFTGSRLEGLIQGLLGDGQNEFWGEVKIGADSEVKILPLWTEDGEIEELLPHIDEEDLKQQLLGAIQARFAPSAYLAPSYPLNAENSSCAPAGNLLNRNRFDWAETLFMGHDEKTYSGINQPLSA